MLRSIGLLLICLVVGLPQSSASEPQVTIAQEQDQLQIRIADSEFAIYNYGPDFRKPFFLPVRSADGTVLTRPLNDPADNDHPHHKGVWLAVDEVNGIKYWVEQGRIASRDVRILQKQGNPAQFEVTNDWLEPKTDTPVVAERTKISIFANGLITWDIHFVAEHGPVEFGDTKEGLLGYRMPTSMKEKNTGYVVSSDGTEGARSCWGRPFAWIDYAGTVDGKMFGVTLMDHPGNFRPSRYHVRNYGLFSISPFGERAYTNGRNEAAHVDLKPDEKLNVQYAIYFHSGDVDEARVDEVYQQFLSVTATSDP